MIYQEPEPSLAFLSQPYLLIQAWKKTAGYIRSHNWYADTMELDLTTVSLPDFINDLSSRIKAGNWEPTPLRIVPAPKKQIWKIDQNNEWGPHKDENPRKQIRPLAHVSIKDQVVATAISICLADALETEQGNPEIRIEDKEGRRDVISYGNRLYCRPNAANDKLKHAWGSSKYYRSYFQDYKTFIQRAEYVADESREQDHVYIVNSDLTKFYDLVRPTHLHQKIEKFLQDNFKQDTSPFLAFCRRVLQWEWCPKQYTSKNVDYYIKYSKITGFRQIGLPQGLVSAGFFANLILRDFDLCLRNSIGKEIEQNTTLLDVCRYVDDLRLVLRCSSSMKLEKLEATTAKWLQGQLNSTNIDLLISKEKTQAVSVGGDQRPALRQSKKMTRIQKEVSGGFDLESGLNILDNIQGLLKSQEKFSQTVIENSEWDKTPVPDVRDDTVARFAANRFRTTYRSLRPMLRLESEPCEGCDRRQGSNHETNQKKDFSREDLDQDVKVFALGLIKNWMDDPSNVRQLRIGLDLWPDEEILSDVLKLIDSQIMKNSRKSGKAVAWYCLSELYRAGATETGFVDDEKENLPTGIDISAYRDTLKKSALQTIARSGAVPWFVLQQALLFIAVYTPGDFERKQVSSTVYIKDYHKLILALKGDFRCSSNKEKAILSTLIRRSYLSQDTFREKLGSMITKNLRNEISLLDPRLGYELSGDSDLSCIENHGGFTSLYCAFRNAKANTKRHERCNELTILQFAYLFIDELEKQLRKKAVSGNTPITPLCVQISFDEKNREVSEVNIVRKSTPEYVKKLYTPPDWCEPEDGWRFQLGYLMRFILIGEIDFLNPKIDPSWRENKPIYRKPQHHWFARTHALYNGFSAYGADWLPISEWIEKLLYELLHWPGCNLESQETVFLNKDMHSLGEVFKERIRYIASNKAFEDNTLYLPVRIQNRLKQKGNDATSNNDHYSICVVQKVLPRKCCFNSGDLTLSNLQQRSCHRNHLASCLSAIEKMLELRKTFTIETPKLDLLVFPELSLHEEDVRKHIIPFIREHKTTVLAGMVYQKMPHLDKLVNSALWMIPQYSPQNGFQVMIRRQGKYNLAPIEMSNHGDELCGFRPVQWIMEFIRDINEKPLKLTASICYDATDIKLAANLRDRSDVFIIPAYNRDVKTYDQMAMALHYHMYQMVVVANNGEFGGSSVFAPYKKDYERQVLHLHGQPQAHVAFIDIKDVGQFIDRWNSQDFSAHTSTNNMLQFKTPPAK